MNKKDSEVEEEIEVAAIAKVERMRLFERLERPKLGRTKHNLSSSSWSSTSDFCTTRRRIQTALCRHVRPLALSFNRPPSEPLVLVYNLRTFHRCPSTSILLRPCSSILLTLFSVTYMFSTSLKQFYFFQRMLTALSLFE